MDEYSYRALLVIETAKKKLTIAKTGYSKFVFENLRENGEKDCFTERKELVSDVLTTKKYKDSSVSILPMADPSLRRLSPEMCILSRGGAPTSFNKALTATGSVADKIAPNVMQNAQLQP
jgi:hypothetical protein